MGMETGMRGLRLSSSWMSQAMRSCSLHSEYAPTSRYLWHLSFRAQAVGSALGFDRVVPSLVYLLRLVPWHRSLGTSHKHVLVAFCCIQPVQPLLHMQQAPCQGRCLTVQNATSLASTTLLLHDETSAVGEPGQSATMQLL